MLIAEADELEFLIGATLGNFFLLLIKVAIIHWFCWG